MPKVKPPEIEIRAGEDRAVIKFLSQFGSTIKWELRTDGYTLVVHGEYYGSDGAITDEGIFLNPVDRNTIELTM